MNDNAAKKTLVRKIINSFCFSLSYMKDCFVLRVGDVVVTLHIAKNFEPAVQQLATILCCTYSCLQLLTIVFNVVKMNNIVQCC